jgi:hypothetical protein
MKATLDMSDCKALYSPCKPKDCEDGIWELKPLAVRKSHVIFIGSYSVRRFGVSWQVKAQDMD